jgi:hypothetical protein
MWKVPAPSKQVTTLSPLFGKQGERHHEKETKIEMIFPAFLKTGLLKL